MSAESENAAAAGALARGWRLTAVDRCDRCGAQAYVRVLLPGRLELLFCAHHNRQYSSALADIAVEIQDETMRLARCALCEVRALDSSCGMNFGRPPKWAWPPFLWSHAPARTWSYGPGSLFFFDRTDGGYPRRYRYSATIRSSTSVTPGADEAAATAALCSARECTVPATITVP